MSDDIEERTMRIEAAKKAQEDLKTAEDVEYQDTRSVTIQWLRSLKLSDYELIQTLATLHNISKEHTSLLHETKDLFDEVKKQ